MLAKILLRSTALLAALAAGSAAQAQTTCPFAVAADFPVTYVGYHTPVITVQIRGQNVRMEVDTGSAMSFLTTAAYDRLNLSGTYPTKGAYATGVAGTMQLDVVVMQDVKFGAVTMRDTLLGVTDQASVSRHGVPLVDGVIGNDIMRYFDIGLDLPDNHITFYQPQGCAATQTPWTGQFAPLPITRHKETLANTVDYGVDNATLAATIDTGAQSSLIAQAALSRAGIKPEAMPPAHFVVEGIGSSRLPAVPEQFSSLTIGAESFSDMWVMVANSPMSQFTDALIGEDYLSTHRVFIANSSDTAFFGLTVQSTN
jgi:predicted aspartyl protease